MSEVLRIVLVTGRPGSGKTTAVRRLAGRLADLRPAGFYTEEIRCGRVRQGFRLVDIREGRTARLAHVTCGPPHVGRYGVDVHGFEAFLDALQWQDAPVVILDEIARMECLSPRFPGFLSEVLARAPVVVATRALRVPEPARRVLARFPHELLELTPANRDAVPGQLEAWVRSRLPWAPV